MLVVLLLLPPFFASTYAQGNLKTQDIEEQIERACQTLEPGGLAVAVIKDGKTEVLYTYGEKSSRSGEAVTPRSLFNIASCSKAFTAASIAILVQEGKLDWKDKVTEYIPELKLGDPYITGKLNIIDMLAHRSGLSTFTGDLLWYQTDYTNEQIIQRMEYLPIENNFRSEFGYQNNMYMVAGEIVEKVTGQTWSRFIRERFFEPLDMTTTVASYDELSGDEDIAYPHYKGEQMELYDFNGTKPAASIYSNITDLSAWVKMWLNGGQVEEGTILEEEVLEMCLSPHTLLNVSSAQQERGTQFRAYGLGWSMYDYLGAKVVEHNGGMPGYLSKVTMVPEDNLGIIILNNGFDLFIRRAILFSLLDRYLGADEKKDWIGRMKQAGENYAKSVKSSAEKRLEQRIEGTDPSLKQGAYTGIYQDHFYGKAEVKIQEGKLHLTLLPAASTFTSSMKHWHFDTFRVDFKDPFLPFGLITFDFNSKGTIQGFSIDLPSRDFHFQNLYFKKKQ